MLPNSQHKAVDDYLFANSGDDFKRLFENPYTLKAFNKEYQPMKFQKFLKLYLEGRSEHKWCFSHCRAKCYSEHLKRMSNLDAFPRHSMTNDDLKEYNFGNVKSFVYKSPQLESIQEWRKSAISQDLIDLNLISVPDIVLNNDGDFISYPLFDIMGIASESLFEAYSISPNQSQRRIWTYKGYSLVSQKSIENFEFKVSPPIRPKTRYERSSSNSNIVLARVSNRVAKKIFPNKYQNIESFQLNQEAKLFWKQVWESDEAIILTEGHKKALSLLSHGLVAISISESCLGLVMNESKQDFKLELDSNVKKIFTSKPRTVYLNYDYDEREDIRSFVFSASLYLAKESQNYGHKAKIIVLPDSNLKGLDDFIYSKGFDEYKKLYDKALSVKQFEGIYPEQIEHFVYIYKKNKKSFSWCFEPCEGKCLLEELKEVK